MKLLELAPNAELHNKVILPFQQLVEDKFWRLSFSVYIAVLYTKSIN